MTHELWGLDLRYSFYEIRDGSLKYIFHKPWSFLLGSKHIVHVICWIAHLLMHIHVLNTMLDTQYKKKKKKTVGISLKVN